MSDKTKIYDYACGVVNFDEKILFKYPHNSILNAVYELADATSEHFATDEGKADLLLLVQGKLNLKDIKESLITHVVKEFTKLINDGYTMEVK